MRLLLLLIFRRCNLLALLRASTPAVRSKHAVQNCRKSTTDDHPHPCSSPPRSAGGAPNAERPRWRRPTSPASPATAAVPTRIPWTPSCSPTVPTVRTDLIRLNPNVEAYSLDFGGVSPTRPSHYRVAAWSAVPAPAHPSSTRPRSDGSWPIPFRPVGTAEVEQAASRGRLSAEVRPTSPSTRRSPRRRPPSGTSPTTCNSTTVRAPFRSQSGVTATASSSHLMANPS